MSLKRSKRNRFRTFISDTSQAMQNVFRSRSPVPNSSGTHQLEPRDSASTPADSASVIRHELPNNQSSILNAGIASDILTPGHDKAHPITPARASTPEPVAPTIARALDMPIPERGSTDLTPLPRVAAANNPPAVHLPHVQTTGQDISSQGTPMGKTSSEHATTVPSTQLVMSSGASRCGLDIGDTVSATLKASFKMLRSVNMVPTLRSALDVLADCVDVIPTEARNRKDYKELAMNITATLEVLKGHLSQTSPEQVSKAVLNIIDELNQQAAYIREKQGRTRTGAYANAEQDIEDIVQQYRNIEALFRRLQVSVNKRFKVRGC
ncbi:hypothetical protein FRC07_013053 [Ceratobasidium sp. 392]|nr:hypothetical protein FRC07_013053 [Ceratobasidium sp. 392]